MWWFNVLIGIDQLVNAILGGDPDETLSSRAGKARLRGKPLAANIIDALFFWQDSHCDWAIEYDEGRKVPKETK